MRISKVSFILLVLCQCAVKHQPVIFEPFFSEGPSNFSSNTYQEILKFEKKDELSFPEKLSLLKLYQLELNSVTGDYKATLKKQINTLSSQLIDYKKEIQNKFTMYPKKTLEKKSFIKSSLPKEYNIAYDLWNEDENESAMQTIEAILNDQAIISKLGDSELFDIYYLKFRISLDLDDFSNLNSSFTKLVEINECDEKTENAGFLLALVNFLKGNFENALSLLEHECTSGGSLVSNEMKQYWMARLRDTLLNDKTYYEYFFQIKVPEYYSFLSAMRLKKDISFSEKSIQLNLIKLPIEVNNKIDSLWLNAEELLKFGLRTEAKNFLKESTKILKNNLKYKNKNAILYNAHLLQAAGDHLEAFKSYTNVMKFLESGSEYNFIKSVFPMPYFEIVDALSKQWNVDKLLVYSLMRQESSFNPYATSSSGARGLMQIMPYIASELVSDWNANNIYKEKMLYNSKENIKFAIYLISELGLKFPHPVLISSAYNAGLSRTLKWWKRFGSSDFDIFVELIPVEETKEYIKLVLRNYFYYQAITNNGKTKTDAITLSLPPYPEAYSQ